MNVRERLNRLSERLKGAGVEDIKFFVAPGRHRPSKLQKEAADIIEAILAGRTTPFKGLGDSVRQGTGDL